MKSLKAVSTGILLLSLCLIGCGKDEPTKSSKTKAKVFVYGLIGIQPGWNDPDSSECWVYARIFNYPDCQDVTAELSRGTAVIPLEADYWDSDKFFTEGRAVFSFEPSEEYGFKMQDSKKTFSGKIKTLPRMTITVDTVIDGRILLEWYDINADFYDIELNDWRSYERHYQVEDNQFEIDISELPVGSSERIQMTVAGFKGFSPISKPAGNVDGCYGYLFGYSMTSTTLDLQTMVFLKAVSGSPRKNLDKLIMTFMEGNSSRGRNGGAKDINYQFTYGAVNIYGNDQSSYADFSGLTIVDPSDAVSVLEGYLDDVPLDVAYNWAGFFNYMSGYENVYPTYDENLTVKFKLRVNNAVDSAFTASPDTFSILTHPPTDQIPAAPFEISWRKPDNADFFFVYATWQIEGDPLDRNVLHITDKNYFTFTDVPDSVVEGTISVTAMCGSNPLHTSEPNLKKINGYLFARRFCRGELYFPDNIDALQKGRASETVSAKERAFRIGKKIDDFILSKFSEKNPELKKYGKKILNQIQSELCQ